MLTGLVFGALFGSSVQMAALNYQTVPMPRVLATPAADLQLIIIDRPYPFIWKGKFKILDDPFAFIG